ncbi:collagen binding domain-containing protein [Lysinibacillus sp. C5.1]|uniref:collagen binding domain-containing protein n=1 Tax=Lysinibacillus sp. C5.1 TaxID=2796169 RepID=UPI0030821206
MKKLNLAIITLLLVFQTVLSPISVFAEDTGSSVPPAVEAGNGETTSNSPDTGNPDAAEPTPGDAGNPDATVPTPGDTGNPDATVPTPGDTGEVDGTDANTGGTDNSTVTPPDESDKVDGAEGEAKPSEEATDATTPQIAPMNIAPLALTAGDMQGNVSGLSAGIRLTGPTGEVIENSSQIPADAAPKKGDTVYLNYVFDVKPTQGYGVGSTFTFDLPQYMIEQVGNSFSGSKTTEYATYSYSYSAGKILVTLESDIEDGVDGEIEFDFMAKFGNFQDESKLDQELVMPVLGKADITLPFIFQPTGSGEPITKSSGAITREADGAEIDWTVWVNTEGKPIVSGATVDDTPDANHAFIAGSLVVEKYPIGLNGINKSNPGAPVSYDSGSTAFPVNLDAGGFAYKLTYKTKVTADPTSSNMTYKNTAEFTNNGVTKTSPGQVNIPYGPALLKTIKSNNKYEASWEIKYNWLGEDLSKKSSQSLTDTIPANNNGAKHNIQYDANFQVYRVTLNDDGQTAASETLLTKDTDYALSDDTAQGFTIDFSKDVAANPRAAYLIKYNTEFDQEFVTDANAGSITNTVKRLDDDSSSSDTVSIVSNIFSKERGAIDYVNKTITWKLTINAEKPLTNFVIADTISTKNASGKTLKHKLTSWDGSSKVFHVTNSSAPTINNGGEIGDEAFTMTFSSIPSGTVTIEYKTKFDIESNGGVAQSYDNVADATWDGQTSTNNKAQKNASYKPSATSPTGKNGYKDNAIVDNSKQEFSWKIGININKQNIEGAKLIDTLGTGHHIIVPDGQSLKDAITVNLLKLGVNDERGTKDAPLDPTKWDVKSVTQDAQGNVTSYELTFTGLTAAENNEAYLIEYKSKDSDDVYGNGSTDARKYTNSAVLDTPDNGKYSYDAIATITDKANKLITKTASPQPTSDTIEWTVTINESNSKLGNITLTDTPSANQKLLTNTFTKQEIKLNATGKSQNVGTATVISPSDIQVQPDGTFTLDLGNVDGKGYIIKYKTYFMGDPNAGENVSNNASINYAGATSAGTPATGGDNKLFKYSTSDTNASAKKGTFKIKKQGVNPNTGATTTLDGVEFKLYNRDKSIVLAEGSTVDGELSFENLRYGIYKLEETTPAGYKAVSTVEVRFNDSNNFEVTKKPYTIVNVEDIAPPANACKEFELTIKDLDGSAIADQNVTLKDANGTVKYTGATTNGVVKVPNTVLAGQYDVYDANDTKIGNVTVKYTDGCKDEIAPIPACPAFTITLNEKKAGVDVPRAGVTVTLKDSTGSEIVTVTTDKDGKFTVPSIQDVNGVKAGEYYLYEGNQFLSTVDISYKGNCETAITQAPKCETFKLTVKDVDGNLVADGTSVTVKDADDKIVATKTTTNGVLELTNLQPGIYKVEVNGKENGSFQSNVDCAATVQPAPSCPIFTLTVKDENGNVRPNVSNIMIKDKNGATIASNKTTDALGQVTMPSQDIPSGDYSVYQGDLFIGQITVQYSVNCHAEIVAAPTCPSFTLTVQTAFGTPLANAIVTVKDVKGNTIKDANGNDKLTTSVAGTIVLPDKAIQQGTYNVYEGSRLIGSFVVKDTCSALVKPSLPGDNGGGGGSTPPEPGKPVDPNKPTPEPGKPVDPNKPTPEPGKPVDPNKPTPEPGKPVDPNKPTPEPGKPVDPNKPTPDPEQPVNPENPSTNTEEPSNPGNPSTDSKDSTAPGKTDTSKPSVQDVIDQGKNLPSINTSTANKDTLDAYKDFIDNYNQLSKEEQEEIAKSLDVDKIKADAKRLETQLQAQGKLPQTDGANQTALTLTGVALVLGALFFLRRRKAEMK